MNNPWRFFIVAEALLFILALWQIVHNPGLAVLLTIGVLLVAYVSRKASKTHFNNFQFVLGVVFIVIGAMNSTAVFLFFSCPLGDRHNHETKSVSTKADRKSVV